MTPRFNLEMDQGATFTTTFNWYGGGKFMAPIEDICIGYPTRITVTDHLLPSNSDTPVIISGVEPSADNDQASKKRMELLNSTELGIAEVIYVDANNFDVPISTVKCNWETGTGEITWHKPTPITGFTARMHIREKWHSTDFIHELTTENGGITLTVEDASIQIDITAADTTAFTFNIAVYDIEMISPTGEITRVVEGTIKLIKEITK